MRRRLTLVRRAAAIAVVLLTMCAAVGGRAFATTDGQATRTKAVTSGTWRAAPSATTFTFTTGGLSPPQYLSVTNSGSLALVGATYAVTITSGTGTVSVKSCTLAWNETLNLCAGITTTVVTSANSPQSTTVVGAFPAAAAASVRLQISDAGAGAVTATFATSVNRSQARAATTTNS
jgi:hypothetical protein